MTTNIKLEISLFKLFNSGSETDIALIKSISSIKNPKTYTFLVIYYAEKKTNIMHRITN